MKKRFCLLMLSVLIISIFASCLVACNEKNRLEGNYLSNDGKVMITFKSIDDKTGTFSYEGSTLSGKYLINNTELKMIYTEGYPYEKTETWSVSSDRLKVRCYEYDMVLVFSR